MPFDPTTPRSRDEVLLQAIVSGDSSAMGDPRDREEEFVKAIADKETLPDYSEASEGDVLKIGQDGPEWAEPSVDDLYEHHIVLKTTVDPYLWVAVTMLSSVATPATNQDTFKNVFNTEVGVISCSGFRVVSGSTYLIFGIDKQLSTTSMVYFHTGKIDFDNKGISSESSMAVTYSQIYNISDNVIKK